MAVPVMPDSANVTGRVGGTSQEAADAAPIQHLMELARSHEGKLHDLRVEHDALRAEVEALRRMLQVGPRRSSKEDVSTVTTVARRSLGSSASAQTATVVKQIGGFQRQTRASVQRHSSPQKDQQIVPLSKPAFKVGQPVVRKLNPNLGPTLRAAVEAGNDDAVRRLLCAHANPEDCDDKGVSTLHLAAFHGKEPICRSLLRAKASANVSDQHGQSPLFFAPSNSICEVLLEQQADVNVVNNKGQTALHFAGQAGMGEVFLWLWKHMSHELLDSQDAYNANGIYYARAAGVKEDLLSKLQPRSFSPNDRGSIGRLATVLEEDAGATRRAAAAANPDSSRSSSRGRQRQALEDRSTTATDSSQNRKAPSPGRRSQEGSTLALGKLSMARAAKAHAKAAGVQRSSFDANRRTPVKGSPQQAPASPFQFSPRSNRSSCDSSRESARRELEFEAAGSPDSPEQSVKDTAARCIQAVFRARRGTSSGPPHPRETNSTVTQAPEQGRRSIGGGGGGVARNAAKAKASRLSQATPPRQPARSMQKACQEIREITKQDVRERQLRIQRARGQASGVLPGEIESSSTSDASLQARRSGERSRTSVAAVDSERKTHKSREALSEASSPTSDRQTVSPTATTPESASEKYAWTYPTDLIGKPKAAADAEQQSKPSSPGGEDLEQKEEGVLAPGSDTVKATPESQPTGASESQEQAPNEAPKLVTAENTTDSRDDGKVQASGETPAPTPAENAAENRGEIKAEASSETPSPAPAEIAAEKRGDSKAEASSETPAPAPAESETENRGDSTAEASEEAPTSAQAEDRIEGQGDGKMEASSETPTPVPAQDIPESRDDSNMEAPNVPPTPVEAEDAVEGQSDSKIEAAEETRDCDDASERLPEQSLEPLTEADDPSKAGQQDEKAENVQTDAQNSEEALEQ